MFDHSISGMYSCTWIFSVYKMKFLLKKCCLKLNTVCGVAVLFHLSIILFSGW